MTRISDIANYLESIAPRSLAAEYDNVGLLCGDSQQTVTGIVTCLDVTDEVIDEARQMGANLIVSHHPLIFSGIKRLRPDDMIGRLLIQAVKFDIALYAIHTNLDFVLRHGVNEMLAKQLGWDISRPLAPETSYLRWSISVADLLRPELTKALHDLIANQVQPQLLTVTDTDTLILDGPMYLDSAVQRIASAYQAQVTSWSITDQQATGLGAGLLVQPALPTSEQDVLQHLSQVLQVPCIRHTPLLGKSVDTIALCGGSGSFLLPQAKAAGAQLFVTGDYKYHQFFEADGDIVIVDVGHYESEQFTAAGLQALLSAKFTTFATLCTRVVTNPIEYFIPNQ